jgi:hypothetical protein
LEYCTNKQMKIQNISICFLFFFIFRLVEMDWPALWSHFDLYVNLIVDRSYLPAFKVNLGDFTIPFVYFYCFISLFPDRFLFAI